MARQKSPRKDQKKNSTEAGDTAATAPVRESTPDTAETDGATEEPDPEIAVTEQIESLPLSQPTVPYPYSPN